MTNNFSIYLQTLERGFRKLCKLEFLQPDGSVAFSVGSRTQNPFVPQSDTAAFLQSGALNVSLQNGKRRSATITLANIDDKFDFSINHIWYGTKLRLLMGLELPNGEPFYLPQGEFFLKNPKSSYTPKQRQITYNLVDKWANLDGTLLGQLPKTYTIPADTDYFAAIQDILHLSKYDMGSATDPSAYLDSTPPVFTNYYDGKQMTVRMTNNGLTYFNKTVLLRETPFEITVQIGRPVSELLLGINDALVGWIGYDQTGALRVDSAKEDILDSEKPILYYFNENNSLLAEYSESCLDTDIYNNFIVIGSNIRNASVYGIATNYDPSTTANVNMIGMRTFTESRPEYYTAQQCEDRATFLARRQAMMQKSISLRCGQMFHLYENGIISVQRPDKQSSPVEQHVIQSFTLPIAEKGNMTITATSVNDLKDIQIQSSQEGDSQ